MDPELHSQPRSFPPIEGKYAYVLILGSMPGIASLDAVRYYAHPRNAFWPITLTLIEGHANANVEQLPYNDRTQRLTAAGIAVWDVLASCERKGSLDSAIQRDSERPNDIPALVARHPELKVIAFNGQAAEKLFKRHVADQIRCKRPDIAFATLPSTSPAYAAVSQAEKQARWHATLSEPLSRASVAQSE